MSADNNAASFACSCGKKITVAMSYVGAEQQQYFAVAGHNGELIFTEFLTKMDALSEEVAADIILSWINEGLAKDEDKFTGCYVAYKALV